MELSDTDRHQEKKDQGSYEIVNIKEVEQPHHVSIHVASIKKMLQELHPITSERSIYRVSKRLHNINHTAYTPQAISIGPFHHGRKDLMRMEQLKLRFLEAYLRRTNMEVEAAFEIAKSWESRARDCYAEPINMKSDEFVKMMLVDGCFLVEFMLLNFVQCLGTTQTELTSSSMETLGTDLYRDFIMLENQLPFFILECLFEKCSFPDKGVKAVTEIFLTRWFIGAWELPENVSTTRKPNHFVDLLSLYFGLPPVIVSTENWINERKSPPTATKLSEAGVKFQKEEQSKLITDISFKDGILKIPYFDIHDGFETYVRNLLAFEHNHAMNDARCIIQYVLFLDELISTEKDVSLLVEAGVISNNIGGSNEEVSNLFNNLCKDVNIACDFYYYSEMSEALHKYCKTTWHRSMASLRRDYFNTPWAWISFLAATIIILLTAIQTIYSAL